MTDSIETMSDAIRSIAKSMRELRSTRLKESTLLLLIREGMPVKDRPTLKQIKLVLDAAERLEKDNLK